jgi:hypothetical protein
MEYLCSTLSHLIPIPRTGSTTRRVVFWSIHIRQMWIERSPTPLHPLDIPTAEWDVVRRRGHRRWRIRQPRAQDSNSHGFLWSPCLPKPNLLPFVEDSLVQAPDHGALRQVPHVTPGRSPSLRLTVATRPSDTRESNRGHSYRGTKRRSPCRDGWAVSAIHAAPVRDFTASWPPSRALAPNWFLVRLGCSLVCERGSGDDC